MPLKQAINELEGKRERKNTDVIKKKKKAKNIADRMKEFTVSLRLRAVSEGKLFGPITSKDVAQALKRAV